MNSLFSKRFSRYSFVLNRIGKTIATFEAKTWKFTKSV